MFYYLSKLKSIQPLCNAFLFFAAKPFDTLFFEDACLLFEIKRRICLSEQAQKLKQLPNRIL
jgi:hypothetical protein